MSGWEVATWLAIAVLVFGSLAVFAWFAVDVRAWLREQPARRDADCERDDQRGP
jgi:hypothetical protein